MNLIPHVLQDKHPLAKLKWRYYQWQKLIELLGGVQIQSLENFMTNLFIETKVIQLFSLNIIQYVSWFCSFKNSTCFEMDWVRNCEGEVPNHTSAVCDGWLRFSSTYISPRSWEVMLPHPYKYHPTQLLPMLKYTLSRNIPPF